DMGLLNNYLPGYLNYPVHTEPTLEAWTNNNGTAKRKYLINALKAFWGDAATPENDFAYAWLPKKNAAKDYSAHVIFEGMAKLEMIVVQELWETETAAFWKRPGVDPKTIATEVLLLPASFFMEKNGSVTNSGAMVQWRHAAVKPPGQARPDGEILDIVYRRVRDLLKDSTDPKDDIVKKAD